MITKNKIIGWSCFETIEMSIPNPRSYTVIKVPSDLSSEQIDLLETEIAKFNSVNNMCLLIKRSTV